MLADSGINRDSAVRVSEVFHCISVGAIDADLRSARFSWRELVHLSLLQADGEAKVLGCNREAVDDVLQGFLRVGEKGAVVSKQRLSDEFLEETPKDKETAVCSETDVDAVWQVLFCLTERDAEEDSEQRGGQDASLLNAVGDGETARQ